MSVYIVEEPEEQPIYYNNNNEELVYRLYSPLQKRRFNKVLNQLNDSWLNTYNTLMFLRRTITIEESNNFMNNIHKLFFMEYRLKNNKNKPMKKNKRLNKIRNLKNKL